MDTFEEKLRTLSPAAPSAQLRRKIFSPQKQRNEKPHGIFSRQMSFGWAFAMALAAGFIGFTAATIANLRSVPDQRPIASHTEIQIIEAPPGLNLFDFSQPLEKPSAPEYKIDIKMKDEV